MNEEVNTKQSNKKADKSNRTAGFRKRPSENYNYYYRYYYSSDNMSRPVSFVISDEAGERFDLFKKMARMNQHTAATFIFEHMDVASLVKETREQWPK